MALCSGFTCCLFIKKFGEYFALLFSAPLQGLFRPLFQMGYLDLSFCGAFDLPFLFESRGGGRWGANSMALHSTLAKLYHYLCPATTKV